MANNKYRHHHYNNQPSVEVKGDKEVLQRSIDTLGLPEDTLELLKNNKFNTIFDIAKRTERDMFRVQTFNKKHLIAVKKAINAVGIDFLPFVPKEKPENVGDAEKQNVTKSVDNKPPFEKNEKKQRTEVVAEKKPQQQNPRINNDRRVVEQNQQQNTKKEKPQQQKGQQQQKQQNNDHKQRTELPLEEWIKIGKNGKWGFSNGIRTVIEPRFDEVFCFKEGVACVDDNGKFGYIDQTGKYVIEPKFECAMSFSEGMAVFFEGEKCGYINKSGEVVLSAKYDAATAFENGRAKVKEFGKWSTIDPAGVTLWSK